MTEMHEIYHQEIARWEEELNTITQQKEILAQREAWAIRQRNNWLQALGQLSVENGAQGGLERSSDEKQA